MNKDLCLPHLLTAAEVAKLLRTTRKAIYAKAARCDLPGRVYIDRRLLFNRATLLRWLEENQAMSPESKRR